MPSPTFNPGPVILPTVAIPTPAATATPTGPIAEELDSIGSRTTVLRSLFLLKPTDTTFIGSDELLEYMREELEEEREEIYQAQELYVTLGVLDRDTSYFDLVLAMLGEGVLGFFDTELEKLYLVLEDNDELKPNDVLTYAHEYVHNLQQHFDIYQIREELEDNSDKARALRALIEGGATVSETLYFLQHLDEAEQQAVREAFQDADLGAFRSAPHLIQRTRLFPYREGFQFVAALFQSENSFDRVNEAYSKPPQSSEQILHPEKYVFEEGPVTVELPDIADSLGEGWTMLRQDTLGEFLLRVYLDPMCLQSLPPLPQRAGVVTPTSSGKVRRRRICSSRRSPGTPKRTPRSSSIRSSILSRRGRAFRGRRRRTTRHNVS